MLIFISSSDLSSYNNLFLIVGSSFSVTGGLFGLGFSRKYNKSLKIESGLLDEFSEETKRELSTTMVFVRILN